MQDKHGEFFGWEGCVVVGLGYWNTVCVCLGIKGASQKSIWLHETQLVEVTS